MESEKRNRCKKQTNARGIFGFYRIIPGGISYIFFRSEKQKISIIINLKNSRYLPSTNKRLFYKNENITIERVNFINSVNYLIKDTEDYIPVFLSYSLIMKLKNKISTTIELYRVWNAIEENIT